MKTPEAHPLHPRGVEAAKAGAKAPSRTYVASPAFGSRLDETAEGDRPQAAEDHVWDSLLGAQTATWEAAGILGDSRYQTMFVGLQAVTALHSADADQLVRARRAFDNILHQLGKTPLVSGPSYHLGDAFSEVAAKRQFLVLVRNALLPCLEVGERQTQNRIHYPLLRRAADDVEKSPSKRALKAANGIVYPLYSNGAFKGFYGVELTPTNLPEHEARIARAIDHLAEKGIATALHVAWAALVLLGRNHEEYKNFFSASATEDLEGVGSQR